MMRWSRVNYQVGGQAAAATESQQWSLCLQSDWHFGPNRCVTTGFLIAAGAARSDTPSLGAAADKTYTDIYTRSLALRCCAGIHFQRIKFNFTLFIRRRPCLLFLFLLYARTLADLSACIFFSRSSTPIQFKQRDSPQQVVCFCICRGSRCFHYLHLQIFASLHNKVHRV